MNQINKLERKLNFWPRLKKKLVTASLIAALLMPAAIASFPAMVAWARHTKETQKLESLCGKPVDAEIVAPIRAEALDDYIYAENSAALFTYKTPPDYFEYLITDAHKKYKDIIQNVHTKTGIPKYILGAFVEHGEPNAWGLDAMQWAWPGFVQINEEEAGLSARTLSLDKEQCLLSIAGEYHRMSSWVKDEIVALALLEHGEEEVKKAKQEAGTCKILIDQYQEWRYDQHSAGRKPTDKLKQFDALVEKYHTVVENMALFANLDEKHALEKEIKILWRSTLPHSDPRGYTRTPNSNTYKVALRPEHYKRKQWWVENLPDSDCIKIALRLKKDGYK